MTRAELYKSILSKKSFLCIGLDTDPHKIPSHLLREKDPVFEFNKQIIDATCAYCVSYKPNIAFYESLGVRGWESLQKTIEYIPKGLFTIADAKRGDIGNTSEMYARAFFDKTSSGLEFDSVTVAPYMGNDSVVPFLKFNNKWVILLAVTSNEGGKDFQFFDVQGEPLYLQVIRKAIEWSSPDQLMFVAGATRAELFRSIREIAPDYFLLVPGIGAQGGDLEQVARFGMNAQCGLLVNSSRNIIYASDGKDFARDAAANAKIIQQQMEVCLDKFLP